MPNCGVAIKVYNGYILDTYKRISAYIYRNTHAKCSKQFYLYNQNLAILNFGGGQVSKEIVVYFYNGTLYSNNRIAFFYIQPHGWASQT